jgi:gluconate 2-dehydrogenase gamma chain
VHVRDTFPVKQKIAAILGGSSRVTGRYTRRQFLTTTAKAGAGGLILSGLPFPDFITRRLLAETPGGYLTAPQRRTLDAALARMIPADGAGDWSAASVGGGEYIDRLLGGTDRIYAGGPFRSEFPCFRRLSSAKEVGWRKEIDRLRGLYAFGLRDLDERAGGDFASLPELLQDVILEGLDLEGSAFFAALYAHTMEGVYSHPVYGGNRDFTAWKAFCYQGDVHGVRFPGIGPADASWNVFGGYAPDEMIQPGSCPGQGPTATTNSESCEI